MNWDPRYPGDYRRDTGHLSLAEHGAYCLLLDHYYSTDGELPVEHAALFRLCSAMTTEEQAAVGIVADQFFKTDDDGKRRNRRADRQIEDAGKRHRALSDAGRGVFPLHAAYVWMRQIAERLIRVRVCHGDWQRCLNHHYGGTETAVFLDPPYKGFCDPYGCADIAAECEAWARDNAGLRVALCGHIGDYDMAGWDVLRWERAGNTYAGTGTKDKEAIWFSPACLKPEAASLFDFFANPHLTPAPGGVD